MDKVTMWHGAWNLAFGYSIGQRDALPNDSLDTWDAVKFADQYAADYVEAGGYDAMTNVDVAYHSYRFNKAAPVHTDPAPVQLTACEADNG